MIEPKNVLVCKFATRILAQRIREQNARILGESQLGKPERWTPLRVGNLLRKAFRPSVRRDDGFRVVVRFASTAAIIANDN